MVASCNVPISVEWTLTLANFLLGSIEFSSFKWSFTLSRVGILCIFIVFGCTLRQIILLARLIIVTITSRGELRDYHPLPNRWRYNAWSIAPLPFWQWLVDACLMARACALRDIYSFFYFVFMDLYHGESRLISHCVRAVDAYVNITSTTTRQRVSASQHAFLNSLIQQSRFSEKGSIIQNSTQQQKVNLNKTCCIGDSNLPICWMLQTTRS